MHVMEIAMLRQGTIRQTAMMIKRMKTFKKWTVVRHGLAIQGKPHTPSHKSQANLAAELVPNSGILLVNLRF